MDQEDKDKAILEAERGVLKVGVLNENKAVFLEQNDLTILTVDINLDEGPYLSWVKEERNIVSNVVITIWIVNIVIY